MFKKDEPKQDEPKQADPGKKTGKYIVEHAIQHNGTLYPKGTYFEKKDLIETFLEKGNLKEEVK